MEIRADRLLARLEQKRRERREALEAQGVHVLTPKMRPRRAGVLAKLLPWRVKKDGQDP